MDARRLTFSTLKRELGLESSGHLQHHMQKLSAFISTDGDGSYSLTDLGGEALGVYRESTRTGRALEAVCGLPVKLEATVSRRVGQTGSAIRIAAGALLLALTFAILYSWQVDNALNFFIYGIGFGVVGTPIFGFLGASFLVAGIKRYPGCEVTAIPNALSGGRNYYMPCMVTPFNLPDGRLLVRE